VVNAKYIYILNTQLSGKSTNLHRGETLRDKLALVHGCWQSR